ncbi:hypothetical protein [Paractinoplanes durhamensis]|uniref:hypothetical protein n=1 Tax=Paractinoplanes durhamensis TaxID=113563 RepID=UPI003643EB6D
MQRRPAQGGHPDRPGGRAHHRVGGAHHRVGGAHHERRAGRLRAEGLRGALRTKAIPPSALLGSDWKGPAKLSKGFPAIDRYVQNCSQSSTLKSRHESLKPPTGAYGFYDNVDENTSLNQVSTAAGVDTIARASAFLDFLRTVPQACPTGKALDKFPYRLTAEDGTGGDEELRLRMSITLPGPGEPLVIDMGYVRTGGLVISFYGESRQVDEYLPIATEFATGNLAGTVAGV